MQINKTKGFTLIELVFVLTIIAIIFSIVVVTYPGLLRNMKVRSDRAAANNVARSVKSWYADYSTDENLKKTMTQLGTPTIQLNSIIGVEKYIDPESRPYSLIDNNKKMVNEQKFFVGMVGSGLDAKIIVSIGTEGIEVDNASIANYDGTGAGIIYIER